MLIEPLFAHARQTPDEIAIIDDAGQHTYAKLAAMAAGLGAYVASQTTRPHVGILLPPSHGFVASFYGTLLAGKAVVPMNYLLGDREIAHVIADSGIDTVLTAPPLAAKMQNSGLKVIDLKQLPQVPISLPAALPTRTADELAVLMYTSGTSGLPKGVQLTYGNLQSDVDAAIDYAALEHKHRFLGVIPLFHAFGVTAMMLAPIQLASTVVYLSRFSPVGVMNALREHNVSIMFGVPSMFAAIAHLKNASAEDFKNVYALITGGEPNPPSLRQAFRERFGVNLLEGYGLTETSPVVTLNTPQARKEDSVGRAVPGAIVKIADDNGNDVKPGDVGEVWLKGPMIMKGYYNLPDANAAALTPDRYFKTGDLGRVDEDGFLFITGRKKEMIIVSGEKAFPREIEDVLAKHPAVAEAAVLGKKDPSRGEVVVAFVTAKDGQTIQTDSLRDFCREQGLPQWKCPREITVLPDLPRSPTGKVLKRVLAEQLAAG